MEAYDMCSSHLLPQPRRRGWEADSKPVATLADLDPWLTLAQLWQFTKL